MSGRGDRFTPGAIAMLLLVSLLPALAFVLGFDMLPFLAMPMLFLIPGFLYRDQDPPPGPSGPDGDGGQGPPDPDGPPDVPQGGLPLPDAGPARVRLRDHDRSARIPARPRRQAREPGRHPGRLPHGA